MTNRCQALTVVLCDDILEDDCQPLIDAIAMMKGVLHVSREVTDVTSYVARMRAVNELEDKVMEVFRDSRSHAKS